MSKKKSDKFKSDNRNVILVVTPRGRILFSPPGQDTVVPKTMITAANSMLIVESPADRHHLVAKHLPDRQGWTGHEGTTFTNMVTSKSRLSRDFKHACIALGVREFSKPEVNSHAPAWVKQLFNKVRKQSKKPASVKAAAPAEVSSAP